MNDLLTACKIGDLKTVERLINIVPDINLGDSLEKTSFYYACEYNWPDIVELLLKDSRLDINKSFKKENAFYFACKKNNLDIIKLLINDERLDINIIGRNGRTPFHWVCKSGSMDAVLTLINNKNIDITKVDKNGEGGLYFACGKGNPAIVKLILKDVRTNIKNLHLLEKNILFVACKKKYTEIVKLLLACNMRINTNNSFTLEINNLLGSFPDSEECNSLREELFADNNHLNFKEFVNNFDSSLSINPRSTNIPIMIHPVYPIGQLKNDEYLKNNESFINRFSINKISEVQDGDDE